MNKLIGVLAIQGDFQAHIDILKILAVPFREIRNYADMKGVSSLIVPGGESTTIRKVAQFDNLWDILSNFNGPVMGTCMGSILMAQNVKAPDSKGWGMINMTIRRNAYGRQIDSFTSKGKIAFLEKPFEMVFIRAPKIIEYGADVKPVAWLNDEVVGVIFGNKLALTFHPELSGDSGVHEFFLGL